MTTKKFKTVQEEVDWWKSLTQEQREEIIAKKTEQSKKRQLKSSMKKMDVYLRSGARTY